MTQMVSILLICIALAIAGFIICPVTAENSETLTTNELLLMEELGHLGVVELDEERKANMVSNLMVVLCSEVATQPIVNTGSLY